VGVDVVLKARLFNPPMSAEDFGELRRAFAERWPPDPYYDGKDYHYPDLGFDEYEPVQTIEAQTLWRYYGRGYERGPWPEIRDMGDWAGDRDRRAWRGPLRRRHERRVGRAEPVGRSPGGERRSLGAGQTRAVRAALEWGI
jgi:hypothetical protein